MPCLALSSPICTTLAWAGPTGGNVVAGSAEIRSNGRQTDIVQSTNRAVIDWRGFSVDAGESVYFRQPSAQAATLNRVTGDQASRILGTIGANGTVILLNPNGVLFGQGARVDVGSLIASTSNLSNDNFMAGRLEFTAPDRPGGSIVNRGTISAAQGGLIALVAPHVRNDGLLYARLGRVAIGSGSSFTIDLNGDGLVNLAIREADLQALKDVEGNPVAARIEQNRNEANGLPGTIAAPGGQVLVIAAHDAKGVIDQVINLGGIVRADTIEQNAAGKIELRASNGRIDLTGELLAMGTQAGQVGGVISVLAPQIRVASSARLNATGQSGGGSIEIGSEQLRSNRISVESGSILDVSSEQSGHGGNLTLSGETVDFRGAAYARGGSASGNGGTIAMSGSQSLVADGIADASAASGAGGALELDYGSQQVALKDDANGSKNATAATIGRSLRTGTNVSVATDGSIELASDLDGRGGRAGGNIAMAGAQGVFFKSDVYTNNGSISASSSRGDVFMNDGRTLFAGNGAISISAEKLASAYYLVTNGKVRIESLGGNVELRARVGADSDSRGHVYSPESVTVRALAREQGEGDHRDDASRGNVQMFDITVSANGSIDVQAARNIRILEKIDPATKLQTRAGIDQARAGEGGRQLRFHSNRLGEPGTAAVGSLTNNIYYWAHSTDPRTRAQVPNASFNFIGAGSNDTTRPDGRWVDLSKAAKAPGDATRVPPGTQVVRDASVINDPAGERPRLLLTEIRPAAIDTPPVLPEPSPAGTIASTPSVASDVSTSPSPRVAASALDGLRVSDLKDGQSIANQEEEDERYSGGRGVAQAADVGKSPPTKSAAPDVFATREHVVEVRHCSSSGISANPYFQSSAFGTVQTTSCR